MSAYRTTHYVKKSQRVSLNPSLVVMFVIVTCVMMFGLLRCDCPEANAQLPSVLVEFNGSELELAPKAIGIVLAAPETCEVGELVHFDAGSSDVDSLDWGIHPATPDFKVVDKGAFFSARKKGAWLVIVAGAKDGQAFLSYVTISAGAKPGKFNKLVEKLEGKQ